MLVYKSEPQSYVARPPGLSTRLFLRLGDAPFETICHLIYPASTPWHETLRHPARASMPATARRSPSAMSPSPAAARCCGATARPSTPTKRRRAGDGAYVVIRDTTCRLFGYHGLINGDGPFSLDHMFGF